MKIYIKIAMVISIVFMSLFGQWNTPDDPPGTSDNIKQGLIDGNKIISKFTNNTIVNYNENLGGRDKAQWPSSDLAKMMGAKTRLLVGYKVYLDNAGNVIDDPMNLDQAVDTLYFLENGFDNGEEGFLPTSGYDNPSALSPAISDDPNTWPESWNTSRWSSGGEKVWNGRRGKGYHNADLESYFVTNNFANVEDKAIKIRCSQRSYQWKTFPMQDIIIWEYALDNESDMPAIETYFGFTRENAIGGDDYYGGEVIYSDTLNDAGTVKRDITYTWDVNFMPIERPAYPALIGFSVLQTPGNEYDGIDNDGDGLIDESQYNHSDVQIAAVEGVDDIIKFRKYNGLGVEAWKKLSADLYYESDEDKDWLDGEDIDGNGVYDYGIDTPNDDVGIDGIGPYDVFYDGPDEGEGNHKPDFGEPNYGPLDYGESDQVPLQVFKTQNLLQTANYDLTDDESIVSDMATSVYDVSQNSPAMYLQLFATQSFPFHPGITERISYAEIHSYAYLDGLNTIPVSPGTEYEPLEDLYNKKSVIERVAIRDYNFAKPPLKPEITVTPQNGQIFVSWNDISQKFTYDPFVGNHTSTHGNDFEGYKIYKSTDAEMSDAKIVTNAYGEIVRFRPIKQFDHPNGLHGFVNYGVKGGNGYYLGNDGGLNNFFIDKDVLNGKQYFYAIVAYDQGTPEYVKGKDGDNYGNAGVGDGISPLENNFTFGDEYQQQTVNVASGTPQTKAIGYVNPDIEILKDDINFGTGWVEPEVKLAEGLKQGHIYKVKFEIENFVEPINAVSEKSVVYRTDRINVYDVTDGTDSLIYFEEETPGNFTGSNYEFRTGDRWPKTPRTGPSGFAYCMKTGEVLSSSSFDGLALKWYSPVEMPQISTNGWSEGSGNIDVTIYKEDTLSGEINYTQDSRPLLPLDFDIVFTDNQSLTTTLPSENLVLATGVYDLYRQKINNAIFEQPLNFCVITDDILDSLGRPDTMKLFIEDKNANGTYDPSVDPIYPTKLKNFLGRWIAYDKTPPPFSITFPKGEFPTDGVYKIRWDRNFWKEDSLVFKVNEGVFFKEDKAAEAFDDIKVVPNPYVVTHELERKAPKGEREKMLRFVGLPPQCKIDIFTLTGMKIKTIDFDNSADGGINGGVATWNLVTENGHDISAGYYIYKITSDLLDKENVGKFAIIK